MSNLVSMLIAGVEKQRRETALVNCFKTWDGEVDHEVILQGIMDRLTAVNKKQLIQDGIRAVRCSLNKVIIETPTSTLFTVHRFAKEPLIAPLDSVVFPHEAGVICITLHWGAKDCFHEEELTTLGAWVMTNVYH